MRIEGESYLNSDEQKCFESIVCFLKSHINNGLLPKKIVFLNETDEERKQAYYLTKEDIIMINKKYSESIAKSAHKEFITMLCVKLLVNRKINLRDYLKQNSEDYKRVDNKASGMKLVLSKGYARLSENKDLLDCDNVGYFVTQHFYKNQELMEIIMSAFN